MTTCETCQQPLPTRPGVGRKRRFCSDACRRESWNRRRREERGSAGQVSSHPARFRVVASRPSARGADEWRNWVLATYSIDETAGRLLDLAVDAWRRYEQARSTLDEAGLTVEVDGRTVARPEVAIERDARAAFQRLLNQLGLDSAGEPEERSAKA